MRGTHLRLCPRDFNGVCTGEERWILPPPHTSKTPQDTCTNGKQNDRPDGIFRNLLKNTCPPQHQNNRSNYQSNASNIQKDSYSLIRRSSIRGRYYKHRGSWWLNNHGTYSHTRSCLRLSASSQLDSVIYSRGSHRSKRSFSRHTLIGTGHLPA